MKRGYVAYQPQQHGTLLRLTLRAQPRSEDCKLGHVAGHTLIFFLRALHLWRDVKMKKASIGIFVLFLATGGKIQGMSLYSTLDTNSTKGNYFGGIYFSFSMSDNFWNNHSFSQTFTDNFGVQINLGFVAGLAEAPGELNLLSFISVIDPAVKIEGNRSLGNGVSEPYDISGGGVLHGTATCY